MTYGSMRAVKRLAQRVIVLVDLLDNRDVKDDHPVLWTHRESIAALRRRSMDLTRALADMRRWKPEHQHVYD